MRSFPKSVIGRRPSPLALTVVVVAAITVALGSFEVLTYNPGADAPTPSPSSTPVDVPPVVTQPSTATPTEVPSPISSPGTTMIAAGFTTPGVAAGWNGFAAGRPAADIAASQVLEWRGGYVASTSVSMRGDTSPAAGSWTTADGSNPPSGLWTSTDGQTWKPVTSIDATAVLVSVAPCGLVAIGVDPIGPRIPRSTWTSSDGVTWYDAGDPGLPGELVSIAGTAAGIVATLNVVTSSGTGPNVTLIEFSVDGVNWTPENIDPALTTSDPGAGLLPHVQANSGRFFLMGTGGPATSATGIVLASSQITEEMWWSDDGKTWTRTRGSYSMSADFIDFGRDGLLLHTNSMAVPGGAGLALSTDGGKTWMPYDTYGPLGPMGCQGACSLGSDGVIGSNGTTFVAVKNGGKHAWLSYDGHTWTPIPWTGGDPSNSSYGGFGGFLVMPRGVFLAGVYAAAK